MANGDKAIGELGKKWGLNFNSPENIKAAAEANKQLQTPTAADVEKMKALFPGRGNGKSSGRQASPRGGNGK